MIQKRGVIQGLKTCGSNKVCFVVCQAQREAEREKELRLRHTAVQRNLPRPTEVNLPPKVCILFLVLQNKSVTRPIISSLELYYNVGQNYCSVNHHVCFDCSCISLVMSACYHQSL